MGGSHLRRSERAAYAAGGRVPGAERQAVRADRQEARRASTKGSGLGSLLALCQPDTNGVWLALINISYPRALSSVAKARRQRYRSWTRPAALACFAFWHIALKSEHDYSYDSPRGVCSTNGAVFLIAALGAEYDIYDVAAMFAQLLSTLRVPAY